MAAKKKATPKPKATPKKKAASKKKAAPKKKAPAKAKAAPRKKAAPKKKAAAKKAAPKKAAPKKKAAVHKPEPVLEEAVAEEAVVEAPVVEAPVAKAPVVEAVVAKAKVVDAAPDGNEEEEEEAPKPIPIPKMPPRRKDGVITVAFSPDSDDAFMFYALLNDKVDTEDRTYELVREEIQTLNEKAHEGVYDVTAISFGAWPYLEGRYLLLSCGASFGDGRGPILIAQRPIRTAEVNGLKVAIPGRHTTAALALRVWLPHANLELLEVPFDEVPDTVRKKRARAGVLIHERQLTWREENFVRVVDFGQWWSEKTEGLPLPLGANAIRADIEEEERKKISLDIKRSIAYGLGHREEALDFAMQFAKGLDRKVVDKYIAMYVNELALDYAERGRQAVRLFLGEAKRLGLLPPDALDPMFA